MLEPSDRNTDPNHFVPYEADTDFNDSGWSRRLGVALTVSIGANIFLLQGAAVLKNNMSVVGSTPQKTITVRITPPTPTPAPTATPTPVPIPTASAAEATPTPQPSAATPTPQPSAATPTPQPSAAIPTPQPSQAIPTPQPSKREPMPAPRPTPEHKMATPSPTPLTTSTPPSTPQPVSKPFTVKTHTSVATMLPVHETSPIAISTPERNPRSATTAAQVALPANAVASQAHGGSAVLQTIPSMGAHSLVAPRTGATLSGLAGGIPAIGVRKSLGQEVLASSSQNPFQVSLSENAPVLHVPDPPTQSLAGQIVAKIGQLQGHTSSIDTLGSVQTLVSVPGTQISGPKIRFNGDHRKIIGATTTNGIPANHSLSGDRVSAANANVLNAVAAQNNGDGPHYAAIGTSRSSVVGIGNGVTGGHFKGGSGRSAEGSGPGNADVRLARSSGSVRTRIIGAIAEGVPNGASHGHPNGSSVDFGNIAQENNGSGHYGPNSRTGGVHATVSGGPSGDDIKSGKGIVAKSGGPLVGDVTLHPKTEVDTGEFPDSPQGDVKNAQFKLPTPTVPESMKSKAFDATIVLEIELHADGTSRARVTQGSRYPSLNQAVLDAVHAMHFKPATRDGVPTDQTVRDVSIHMSNS